MLFRSSGSGKGAGESHWAAFSFEKPLSDEGLQIRVNLQHRYQPPFEIARFRIWATASKENLAAGLPNDVIDILQTPKSARTAAQTDRLMGHYRSMDAELRKLEQRLTDAKRPLPEDPELRALQVALSRAARAIPTDAALVQLRSDVALSRKQLGNRRLTAAQDLAWALINTPAFLFNH